MHKTTYTLAEAARLLQCHSETLRRAIRDGSLRAARLGRGYRLSRSDLQAFWTAQGGGLLFDSAFDANSGDGVTGEEGEMSSPPGASISAGSGRAGKSAGKVSDAHPKQLSLIAPQGREP